MDSKFIMILTHQQIEENIKVPFAYGFITPEDWVH